MLLWLLCMEPLRLYTYSFREALRQAFQALDRREKRILYLRFYDGKTQMEVADALGISQAQVSRLEKGAISAMRKTVSVS